jgi:alpha-tubulin suppressor-like RCC1 family protein
MHFSLALADAGNIYGWGWNAKGQLGVGDTKDRGVPTRIPLPEHAVALAAGETHAAALTVSGLWGWGNNAAAQIGNANPIQPHPVRFFP